MISSISVVLYTCIFLLPGVIIEEVVGLISPLKRNSAAKQSIMWIGYSVLNDAIWSWLFWLVVKHDRSWIRKVDDELKTGLLKLSDVQLSIIEKSIFENASVGDLKNELGLSLEGIRIEIKKAREILIRYI